MSILVVDDSLETRSALHLILEGAGYRQVLLAESAQEAFQRLSLAHASAPANAIGVSLMDIMMPDMEGGGGCRRLEGDRRDGDLPTLLVTARQAGSSVRTACADW